MARLCDHLLYKVELPVLSCIFKSAFYNWISTLDKVQIIEGVCNESKLLSSLFLWVKSNELLTGTLLLFSEHICSLEHLPSKFLRSNVLMNWIKLSPKLRDDGLYGLVLNWPVIDCLLGNSNYADKSSSSDIKWHCDWLQSVVGLWWKISGSAMIV